MPVLVHKYNTQYLMHHSSISQPLLPLPASTCRQRISLCLRTSRGAATGGLHKVPRTRKHCQRSRGGAVPDTPSPCFAPAGRPWQPSPGCIGQVSQPFFSFFQCQRSSSRSSMLVGGERREKLRWDQMHAPCNQRRSLETGVSKQRREGENNLESIVERQKREKKFTEGARSRRRTRPRPSC